MSYKPSMPKSGFEPLRDFSHCPLKTQSPHIRNLLETTYLNIYPAVSLVKLIRKIVQFGPTLPDNINRFLRIPCTDDTVFTLELDSRCGSPKRSMDSMPHPDDPQRQDTGDREVVTVNVIYEKGQVGGRNRP